MSFWPFFLVEGDDLALLFFLIILFATRFIARNPLTRFLRFINEGEKCLEVRLGPEPCLDWSILLTRDTLLLLFFFTVVVFVALPTPYPTCTIGDLASKENGALLANIFAYDSIDGGLKGVFMELETGLNAVDSGSE